MKINDYLIIKEPYLSQILNSEKVWEIRGSRTKKRGKIGLIRSGSGLVVGSCDIVDCFELSHNDLETNVSKHQIQLENLQNTVNYKNYFAWVLENPERFFEEISYQHPKGAIIWVKNAIL